MTNPPTPPTDRTALLAALKAAGLLTPAQLAKATTAIPPATTTASQAAQVLMTAGVLTRFQAERLLAGRTDGFVLGSYVIQDQVGRGSVGRVYKATHRTMNRAVAIKVLSADLTRTAAARETFRREIRAAARLNHPNIVTAYDANEVGERSYLVLEFVDGPTMDALVRQRGPLPIGEACELVRQAAVGLQNAHEQGMIHRDVKPANLLVARASKTLPGCVVKIADFGIARLAPVPRDGPAGHRPGGTNLVGTPDYVAPEQAHNPHLSDHRADLYSLGCVFYFLLTGRPPFPGGTAETKIRRHQFEAPVPVDRVRADVPPAVAEIVARLLAKDPNSRFQSASGLAARLDGMAAQAVALDEDELVSFELPAVQPGSYSFTSGDLTGMHSTLPHYQAVGHATLPANGGSEGTETSPWTQLTDDLTEAAVGTANLGTAATPVVSPPSVRRPVKPPAPLERARGPSAVTIFALCGTVVLSCMLFVGYVLRGMAR
ncbi:MAG: prkC 39 [Gemmataceae bacterium]|nr:prkC 39 [Gemmataceae bacterium]